MIVVLLLLCSTPLFASLFGDDEEKEIILPTHEIYFTGQKHIDEETIGDAIGVSSRSFYEFWKEDTPRIADKLLPVLKASLKSFYDSQGFYDADFTIRETNTTVFVNISENKPVKIVDIRINSDYDISSFITFHTKDIFKAKTFITIKTAIIQQLLKEGYCSYNFDPKAYVDLDNHTVKVEYTLQKGEICKFGKLTVKGLESIDEEIVKSRVRAIEGKDFSTDRIGETTINLYSLDVFDSVLIDTNRKFYNVVPVDITVREASEPYHVEAGAGYDTYVGARVQGEIVKKNFFGNAQRLGLKAAWSQREQLLILGYFKPVFFTVFDHGIDLDVKIGYSNLEFEGFREEKSFAQGYLTHEYKKFMLHAGLALENITISALESDIVLQQAVNEGVFNLFYPYVDIIYDARDDRLNPKYGYYLSAYSEYGLSYDEESSPYLKTLLEGRIIHTFSNLTLAAVGKVGVVDDSSLNGLPESKFFFGGGFFSNRAYGFRELGVILSPTEDSIYGASTMANLSLEANYPIWEEIYGAVFTDNTMLTEESYDFSGDIISSAGVGVRYMTPVGPFKLDVGFNVNDPSQYAIQFQVGQSF